MRACGTRARRSRDITLLHVATSTPAVFIHCLLLGVEVVLPASRTFVAQGPLYYADILQKACHDKTIEFFKSHSVLGQECGRLRPTFRTKWANLPRPWTAGGTDKGPLAAHKTLGMHVEIYCRRTRLQAVLFIYRLLKSTNMLAREVVVGLGYNENICLASCVRF